MRGAEISVERQGLLQFADRSRSAVRLDLDEAQPEVRPIVARRNRYALDQQRLGGGEALSPVVGGVDRADDDVGPRGADKSVNIGWIERHGAFENFASALDVVRARLC